MTTALATTAPQIDPTLIERVLLHGDLRQLAPAQKVSYYHAVCHSVGLNPLTQPFAYLVLNGKEILYAKREATEQLRQIHAVSIQIMAREVTEDCYIVTARATLPSGRQDENIGAVAIAGLKGESRANAMMKAETKAKRRVTLAICGLGMLDETEVETIPGAYTVQPSARPEKRENPSAPNGGDSATSTPAVSDDRPVEDDELPPGYHRIDDYRPDGNWHHVYWGRDAQGGTLIYKTKLQKIALKAQAAYNDQLPVKLHSKKFPFLDDVEVLEGWPTGAEVAATKFQYPPDDQPPLTDDDIAF